MLGMWWDQLLCWGAAEGNGPAFPTPALWRARLCRRGAARGPRLGPLAGLTV